MALRGLALSMTPGRTFIAKAKASESLMALFRFTGATSRATVRQFNHAATSEHELVGALRGRQHEDLTEVLVHHRGYTRSAIVKAVTTARTPTDSRRDGGLRRLPL